MENVPRRDSRAEMMTQRGREGKTIPGREVSQRQMGRGEGGEGAGGPRTLSWAEKRKEAIKEAMQVF